MTDHSRMKLGKRPRRHDVRTLMLARYVTRALPSPPARVDYSCGITDWGMMLNDQLGCCTIAAVAHAVQVWSANTGAEISFPDSVIRDYYHTWDGYNPDDPSTDQGGVELDVLKDWRQQGFASQSLDAFGALELDTGPNHLLPMMDVMDAIWLFGGAYIGLELPLSAQTQEVWGIAQSASGTKAKRKGKMAKVYATLSRGTRKRKVRGIAQRAGAKSVGAPLVGARRFQDFNPGPERGGTTPAPTSTPKWRMAVASPDDPGTWGGHAVYLVGYDQETLTCITWGQLKKMTWPWFAKYCSEAYGLVSKDWLKACGISPSGFDMETLEQDLQAISDQPSAASGQLSAFSFQLKEPLTPAPLPRGEGGESSEPGEGFRRLSAESS